LQQRVKASAQRERERGVKNKSLGGELVKKKRLGGILRGKAKCVRKK
jgi:hypothetical protein